jgi:scyllo-inositol 2-dehydrogenase (NADP+)
MAKKEIKAAIIGYGGAFNMGLHHSNSMTKTGNIRTVAVCDADPTRLEQAKGDLGADLQTFTSVDKLLAKGDFDLAVLILPHNLHAPVAVKCLGAGKHVITEKPMCLSLKEADQMIEAARQAKVMLSVFHNRRWDPDFLAIRELVEKGVLGHVFHVEMFFGGWSAPRGWWRDDKKISGGQFFDWGAHFIDWLLQIMPEPIESVTGFFHKRVWQGMTNEDQVQAIVRFAGGEMADVQGSQIARAPKARWRLLGTKGGALHAGDHWQVFTDVQGMGVEMKVPFKEGSWDAYYQNIADHLVRGKELIVKPEQARRVIGIMDCAERSAKTGKPVALPGG